MSDKTGYVEKGTGDLINQTAPDWITSEVIDGLVSNGFGEG